MTEWVRVQTPNEATIFQAPFIWIKSLEQKLSGNQPGIVTYAVILQKGRVDLEGQLAYKNLAS
jgi:hypothetical protein